MDIYKYGKKLRCGYTTGACAAAAAKAAAAMLLRGISVSESELVLKGETAVFKIEDVTRTENTVKCAVRKDAGDDSDITDGMLIYAEVRKTEKRPDLTSENVIICGGEGVGRVTKAGLNQPIGEAAINSGPRRMITEAVMEICGSEDVLEVVISVPGGLEASEKTFNPVLGIEGGISILGSTGIVEPMSEPAIIETIRAEMRVKWLESDEDYLVIVPGNYGMSFVKEKLGISESRIIKCSNFIGEAIDCACELGVKKLLIAGNLGKLVKLAGGIFNTHSRNADCRMDILMRCAFSAMKENDCIMICDILKRLDECVTTDAAAAVLKDAGILDETMKVVTSKAMQHIQRRCRNFEDNAPLIRLIIS